MLLCSLFIFCVRRLIASLLIAHTTIIFFECITLFHEINEHFMPAHVMRTVMIIIVIYAFYACMLFLPFRMYLLLLLFCFFSFEMLLVAAAQYFVGFCFSVRLVCRSLLLRNMVCVPKTCLNKRNVIFSYLEWKRTKVYTKTPRLQLPFDVDVDAFA